MATWSLPFKVSRNVLSFSNVHRRFYAASTEKNLNPLIVCGPSGVGKGTLLNMLLKSYPSTFGTSVSHTTRYPREGEIDGVHYRFIPKALFEEGIARNEYIEYAQVHTNYYGTHCDAISKLSDDGKICILEIDVKGAQKIKNNHSETLKPNFLFITCPNPLDTLTQRLEKRGTETNEQIETRLNTAKIELDFLEQHNDFFDHVLVNEDLNVCMNEFKSVLNRWYPLLNL